MTLREFISDRERRHRLAGAVRCSEGYLSQLAGGYRGKRPSVELAKRIEAASRELGPEAVSAVELVFAEPVVARRRYVRRSQKTTEPTAAQSAAPVEQDAANVARKENSI